jgi:glucuronide carrier protein
MVWLGFSGILLSFVGVISVNILVWALEADTVEYGEWTTGVRSEGIVYALFSFTRKTGQAVGGAIAAYALAWGGYNAAETQTAQAMTGIQAAAGLLPALMTLLAVVVMIWYPLTDARHAEIVAAIKDRRATSSTGHTTEPSS